jgi:hypothetical protein
LNDRDGAALGDDLLSGIKEISKFWGLPERKTYHLASKRLLPGVFQMGRQWFGSKSAARAGFTAKAKTASGR